MSDDSTLTDEELDGIRRGWRELIEDRAHGGKMHYQMPPVRGMAPPGSFRIPKDVFEAVGQGNIKLGAAAIHAMLGVEDSPQRPDLIHPHVVRIIGNGSLAAGHRVLKKFVARVAGNPAKGPPSCTTGSNTTMVTTAGRWRGNDPTLDRPARQ